VVKFFGRLFEGRQSFTAEYQANQIVSQAGFTAPRLLLHGSLFSKDAPWDWPYLIFEYLPSISIGEVYEQVPFEDRLALAQDLGHMTRRLHNLPLDKVNLVGEEMAFPADWNAYLLFLNEQYRHSQPSTGLLPERLLAQIPDYLLSPSELIDFSQPPHLIHADLTRDHILGKLSNGHWQTLGIIDWGDAMTGNILYELLALHLDLFHCDKRLLGAYLDAYGLDRDARRKLPPQAMSLTLTHRFNIIGLVFRDFPALQESNSLPELAAALWEV